MLEAIGPEAISRHFDMDFWARYVEPLDSSINCDFNGCGFAGCGIGWAAHRKVFEPFGVIIKIVSSWEGDRGIILTPLILVHREVTTEIITAPSQFISKFLQIGPVALGWIVMPEAYRGRAQPIDVSNRIDALLEIGEENFCREAPLWPT